MRTRNALLTPVLAIAALILSLSACENVPTLPNDDMAVASSTTSNVQSRVTLCHRNSNEYVAITVADAAYDTHMAHGDTDADLNGECPDVLLSRLELTVATTCDIIGDPDCPGGTVTVTLLPFEGEPEGILGSCHDSCFYEVPTGGTVVLEPAYLSYLWDDGGTSASRVIDRNLSVTATSPLD